jgi:hypothetical protein
MWATPKKHNYFSCSYVPSPGDSFALPSPPLDQCNALSFDRHGNRTLKTGTLPSAATGDTTGGGGPLSSTPRKQAKVLLIPKSTYSIAFKTVTETLVANRIGYKSTVSGKNLPDLIKASKPGVGKYGAIFFEDFRSYLEMDPWNRELLDKYCKTFSAGIVAMIPAGDDSALHDSVLSRQLPVKLSSRRKLHDFAVSADASMLRLVKGGKMLKGEVDENMDWVSFDHEDEDYEGVASAKIDGNSGKRVNVAVQDHGIVDGIPKVLFGGNVNYWLNKLLFLDSLSWVSSGRIAIPLTRYITP